MITAEMIKKQHQQYMNHKAAAKGEDISPEAVLAALTRAERKGGTGDGEEKNG